MSTQWARVSFVNYRLTPDIIRKYLKETYIEYVVEGKDDPFNVKVRATEASALSACRSLTGNRPCLART